MMEELTIKTNQHEELINITSKIQSVVSKYPNANLVTVFVPHTTASITINENADPSVKSDILMGLKSWKFEHLPFSHSEGNSPSHLKASLFGFSQTIIVDDGRLQLGTWQGIYFCEFDGPRSRRVYVKVI